jgi:hypothetical protein
MDTQLERAARFEIVTSHDNIKDWPTVHPWSSIQQLTQELKFYSTGRERFNSINYKCENGCFLLTADCVTISNPDSLSSSETGVNPVISS